MKTFVMILGLALSGVASAAVVEPTESCHIEWLFGFFPYMDCESGYQPLPPPPPAPVPPDVVVKAPVAPEIDASEVGWSLTLLIIALIVLGARVPRSDR